MLSVENDGPVVPSGDLARLADRFERGQGAESGSGLGLAIVAAMAERIDSRLVLESPCPGKDTGFRASLRLPVAG
jgi:two-component system OmpR family sensor kinase